MNKKWEICEYDIELVRKIAGENNISELMAVLLINRGIIHKQEIEVFLAPTKIGRASCRERVYPVV